MDLVRLGAAFRAVRVRRRLRQVDVAILAKVSRATISKIERGRAGSLSVDAVLRVAHVLEIRISSTYRWRGGELDRLLNAGHSALHEAMARQLHAAGWLLSPETSFAIYGERGIIDILGFYPATRALLVIELKTELVDVQALMGVVDRYRRLAPRIARDRTWNAMSVSTWVVLRDTGTNRRRLAAHATVLRSAFPDDGRVMRRWLQEPNGSVAALSFLSDSRVRSVSASSAGVRRVRRPGASVAER
jgi:transcriptional regulator with XRE-family HTH domain